MLKPPRKLLRSIIAISKDTILSINIEKAGEESVHVPKARTHGPICSREYLFAYM